VNESDHSIKHLLLKEDDGGLSSDGLATNAVGTGKIAGLGVPPQENPADVSTTQDGDGSTSLKALTPVGRQRFYSEQLAESKDSIELHPYSLRIPRNFLLTHDSDAEETEDPLLGGGVIEIHPSSQPGSTVRTWWTSLAADLQDRLSDQDRARDVKKINYFRTAIRSSEVAMRNATFRPYVVEVLERLLSLIFTTPSSTTESGLYSRRMIAPRRDRASRVRRRL